MQSRAIHLTRATQATLALALASVICLVQLAVRVRSDVSTEFVFLAKNLFLAWIPMAAAGVLYAKRDRKAGWRWVLGGCAVVWFLFYPNAPYLLTDLVHVHFHRSNAPWFDLLLVMSFAWTGIVLGNLSLHLMHELVRLRRGPVVGWIFTVIMLALGTVGVFVGRFWRWNSHDVILNPKSLAENAIWRLHSLSDSEDRLFLAGFFSFSVVTYITLHAFGRLHLEAGAPPSPPVSSQESPEKQVAVAPSLR